MRDDRIEHRGDMLQRAVFPQGGPIPSEPEIEACIGRQLASHGIKVRPAGIKAVFVNDGRWVIVCDCGAGIACSPSVPHTTCILCGSRYDLEWPDAETQARIEKTLLERPPKLPRSVDGKGIITTRCWDAGDDIDALEVEAAQVNLLHAAAKGVK